MGSYLIYWQHSRSLADKAPECRLLSDDTLQCLHSLALVLQSLGRGKNIPRGTFCTAGCIQAASSSRHRWREGAWAQFWSWKHPGARRGLGGEGRRTFAVRGGCTRQLALLREKGSGRTAGCASPSLPAPAPPRSTALAAPRLSVGCAGLTRLGHDRGHRGIALSPRGMRLSSGASSRDAWLPPGRSTAEENAAAGTHDRRSMSELQLRSRDLRRGLAGPERGQHRAASPVGVGATSREQRCSRGAAGPGTPSNATA